MRPRREPIRIAHLISGLSTGGAETMMAQLVARMDRGEFGNVVISLTDAGTLGRQIVESGVRLHTLNMRPGRLDARKFLRLVRLIRRERPAVLQTWLPHADLLGTMAGRLSGVPAIVWNLRCAELRREDHQASLFWILRILAHLSRVPQAVIANSSAGREAHQRLGYHPRRWEIIPNGFDLERLRPDGVARSALRKELRLADETMLVGIIGRFHPMKDHATFLQALTKLPAQYRESCRILLVGRGLDRDNAELTTLIAECGLAAQVLLLGERSDIPRTTAALDIAVSSSYSEGFSNAIGEAMACGVPCVVTDAGDSAMIVGDAGIVVPPRNPEALAEALQRIIDLPREERARMGMAARARIAAEYSLDAVVRRYEALYRELGEG